MIFSVWISALIYLLSCFDSLGLVTESLSGPLESSATYPRGSFQNMWKKKLKGELTLVNLENSH